MKLERSELLDLFLRHEMGERIIDMVPGSGVSYALLNRRFGEIRQIVKYGRPNAVLRWANSGIVRGWKSFSEKQNI